MTRLVILLLVAASASAQEIAVSDPTFEPQPVASARVAASGDRFITAWGGNGGVFASITDLNGTLVRGPVTVSLTGGLPAVAGGANGTLIAWLDSNAAYTAMIDKDGNVARPTLLTGEGRPSGPLSVVWNGNRFLVVIHYLDAGLAGYLFDANGQRVSDRLEIGHWITDATADGDGFIVFAQRNVDDNHPDKGATIWARRVNMSGTLEPWTQTTSEVTYPRLAAIGRVVFWEYNGVLHRVITDATGAPGSDQEVIAAGTLELQKAVATPSGALLFFADHSQRSWSLMLVGRDRRLLVQQGPISGAISDLAAIGTRALLATSTTYGGVLGGYLVDATSTIHVSDAINIGQMATGQLLPQVASNGPLLFAAWLEFPARLFAARIDPQGRKHLDGRGILLDSHQYLTAPAVAPLGNGFVVAYLEVSSGVAHLMIRRVFPDGTLDAAPTLVSTTAQPWPPRLASDGNQALLVWTENTYSVRGTRISREGAILDPAFLRISDGDTGLAFVPDVGIEGESYLVAWQKQTGSGRGTQLGMSAVRVTSSGVVLNPTTPLPMLYFPRIAGSAVAARTASHVLVDFLGTGTLDLGANIGLGDIEQLGDGFLVVGTESTGFQRNMIWAAFLVDGRLVNRFEPLPHPTPADTPSLAKTPTGVALTYVRATGDEGYGGSLRAYVLPISEQRRRTAR
ncbi:MAG TPA: hypothetical protein VER58_18665 [Thermoanaerobaculia bacterium]|nr:hypothetical protein [Thermoanaerobaculia bacterium]